MQHGVLADVATSEGIIAVAAGRGDSRGHMTPSPNNRGEEVKR